MADAAAFSTAMATFVGNAAITAAFPYIKAREVNALEEKEFPLLAYWVRRGGLDGARGSDGALGQDVTYQFLVATQLEDDQAQDVELGKLVKVVKDLAGSIVMASGAEFEIDEWETDSGARQGDGAKVWAAFDVTVKIDRPKANY